MNKKRRRDDRECGEGWRLPGHRPKDIIEQLNAVKKRNPGTSTGSVVPLPSALR
jgi:hypothetical protein